MKASELRIGNLIERENYLINKWDKEKFHEITTDKSDIYACVVSPNKFKPIPLTEEWLVKLPKDLVYPDWIEFIHDLQNWYYYNNKKKELVFKL